MARLPQEHDDIASDLKATLAARRELGPEMDDELVELFLARVDSYIKAQVASQRRARPRKRRKAQGDGPGFPRPLLAFALFLFLLSLVFGVHAPTVPLVAVALLLAAMFSHRGCSAKHDSRQL